MSIDTNAIRIQIDELRATIIELRQDLADSEIEVDRLEGNNSNLSLASEQVSRKVDKLTAKNKVMREALEKALQKLSGGHIDYYETTTLELQNLHEQAGYAFNIIEDALEATKEKV